MTDEIYPALSRCVFKISLNGKPQTINNGTPGLGNTARDFIDGGSAAQGFVGGGGAAQIIVGEGGASQGVLGGGGAAQGLLGGGSATQGLVGGGSATQGLVGLDDQLLGRVTLDSGGNNITAPTLDIHTYSLPASQAYNNFIDDDDDIY